MTTSLGAASVLVSVIAAIVSSATSSSSSLDFTIDKVEVRAKQLMSGPSSGHIHDQEVWGDVQGVFFSWERVGGDAKEHEKEADEHGDHGGNRGHGVG